jgi:hypothetical protein
MKLSIFDRMLVASIFTCGVFVAFECHALASELRDFFATQ